MVWETAHLATLEVYRLSKSFPREEMFGLTSQIRRAAVSLPANIAEGCGRGGNKLIRFCRISVGSATELQYHLLLAHDLGYLNDVEFGGIQRRINEVERMLTAYIERLADDDVKTP